MLKAASTECAKNNHITTPFLGGGEKLCHSDRGEGGGGTVYNEKDKKVPSKIDSVRAAGETHTHTAVHTHTVCFACANVGARRPLAKAYRKAS